MSSRSSRHSISKRDRPSSKTKKTDDWTEVTEPDERRRIQNRIAQRKFREKAREQKDRAARDAQNQQYAGSAYHIPDAEDLTFEDDGADLSGLPWGGLNMRHVVARGHASASAGHHTHSHSGHTGTGGSSSSVIHGGVTTAGSTPGPAVDHSAMYGHHHAHAHPHPHMSPYASYAPHPVPVTAAAAVVGVHGHAVMVDAAGEVYHGYEPSYAAGGYYDFDPAGADPGHGM